MSDTNNNIESTDSDNESHEQISSADVLSQIDKKLILKFHKDGKHSKTYVCGLDKYFDDVKQNEFIKTFKKKLGTSCSKNIIDGSNIYSFGGDHVNTMYEYFSKIIPKHELKKQ